MYGSVQNARRTAFGLCKTASDFEPQELGDILAVQGRICCIFGDYSV